MTISKQGDRIEVWYGLSTDTKPATARIPIGSKFVEYDTGKVWVWVGTWVENLSIQYTKTAS